MKDYLSNKKCIQRLLNEVKQYGKIFIAFDYDNTIYDYHNQGLNFTKIIKLLQQWKPYAQFICFTCCDEREYANICQYCETHSIPLDFINFNPEISFSDTGKIYYNILLDDRAGLKSAYQILKKTLRKYKNEL